MLVDDLTLTTKLGMGSFAKVYLTTKQGTSTKYATKVIDKAKNHIFYKCILSCLKSYS